jgi:hypothetical protein
MDFKLNLSHESWDNIFLEEDVNVIFNNLLNTYLNWLYVNSRVQMTSLFGFLFCGITKMCILFFLCFLE